MTSEPNADRPWLELLRSLRPSLSGQRGPAGVVGSLNWLEREMQAEGSAHGAVRNIVYRNLGTALDKSRLMDILSRLGASAGLAEFGSVPTGLRTEVSPVRQLLGRDKRTVSRQFLSALKAGSHPKRLLFARHGSGKTLLLDHLSSEIGEVSRLHLGGELSMDLARCLQGDPAAQVQLGRAMARLDSRFPYALQGDIQAEVAAIVRRSLVQRNRPLLIRVGTRGELSGQPLRTPDGSSASLGGWVWLHLLLPLGSSPLAIMALLSGLDELPGDLGPFGPAQALSPPTLEEARRHVLHKSPDLPAPRVAQIARQAGRDYEALTLLTLLEGVDVPDAPSVRLPALRDLGMRDFLETLSVLAQPTGDLELPVLCELLKIGQLGDLPALERAFLEQSGTQRSRPVRATLLEQLLERYPHGRTLRRAALHSRAARAYLRREHTDLALYHALQAKDTDLALSLCLDRPELPEVVLEAAWLSLHALEALNSSQGERFTLSRVEHYAHLGRHDHPSAVLGRTLLGASDDPALRQLAALLEVAGLLEQERFDEVRAATSEIHLPSTSSSAEADDRLRAEDLLIQVGLGRWAGQQHRALGWLSEVETLELYSGSRTLQTRVLYWRGLLQKDLGHWDEALAALRLAAGSAHPLLAARACAQLGDALVRLGQQTQAMNAFEDALERLRLEHAPPSDLIRARIGYGVALRRLGRLGEAMEAFAAAVAGAPDGYTRARAQSEAALGYAALGQYDEALNSGVLAWQGFAERRVTRPLEVAYRQARATYRVALTYLVRGLNQPYLPPLTGATHDHPDLTHARLLLLEIVETLQSAGHTGPETLDRNHVLEMDAHLSLSLATPDLTLSQQYLQRALDRARTPYRQFQVHLYAADSFLRFGQREAAMDRVNRGHAAARRAAQLAGSVQVDEPGFTAWLALLETLCLLPDEPEAAALTLASALREPGHQPFCARLISQAVGRGVSLEAVGAPISPLLRAADQARMLLAAGVHRVK